MMNTKPIIIRESSHLSKIETDASVAPKEREPKSPINILAG